MLKEIHLIELCYTDFLLLLKFDTMKDERQHIPGYGVWEAQPANLFFMEAKSKFDGLEIMN